MLRLITCLLLNVSVALAQQPGAGTPSPDPQKQTMKKRRSRKGLWITLAVVAGVTVVALVAVNKRLANEGHGIF